MGIGAAMAGVLIYIYVTVVIRRKEFPLSIPISVVEPQQLIIGALSAFMLLRTIFRVSSMFGVFCLGCLCTPLLVTVVHGPQHGQRTLAPREFDAAVWAGHFADPAVVLGGALMLLAETQAGKLSAGDQASASWYLLNGGVIHTMMDGMTGGYHFLPLMDENYRRLDNRANGVLVDGRASKVSDVAPSLREACCMAGIAHGRGLIAFNGEQNGTVGLTDDAVAVAMVVFRMELYVMAPLCFLTYWAIQARKGFAPALEIITLTMQICGDDASIHPSSITAVRNSCLAFHPAVCAGVAGGSSCQHADDRWCCPCWLRPGTVWFVGPELLTGCVNMVPFGIRRCVAGFSSYELLYFWFAVGANCVWIVVPVMMICHAAIRINHAAEDRAVMFEQFRLLAMVQAGSKMAKSKDE
jgi:hypothetical protein